MTRVAVVTGGASGIGRAAVQLLEKENVRVAVLDRAAETGAVDVSDPDAVRAAVEEARQKLGPISIVVNAAGVASAGRLDDDHFPDEWDRALSINLSAAMHVVRACLPDLVSRGQGRIVNVAST
jgi:NAD(P)-dependent dehydrogenase (short-subunit alcohol dehydrogenase family)